MSNWLVFTTVRYSLGVSLFLMAGLLASWIISRRRTTAGIAMAAIVIVVSVYGQSLIDSSHSFFGLVNRHAHTTRRVVALTFDDGPSALYTPRILDILKKNKSNATFFVLGKNASRNPEIIRRMVKEGNQIGNHTYSHFFLFTKSGRVRENEILKTHSAIKIIAGVEMKYFRAPYEYRDLRLMRLLDKLNYRYIGHDIGTADGARASSAKIVERIMSELHPGAIISMHDSRGNREATVKALQAALPMLKKRGYTAVTVEELLSLDDK